MIPPAMVVVEAPRRRWSDWLTPSTRVLLWLDGAIKILLAILVCWLLYLAIWPQHVITIEAPILAEPTTVRAGDALTLSISYDKPRDGASDLGLFLASRGRVIVLPSATVALPAGLHRIAVVVPVPAHTPPGSYKAYLVRETRASYFPQPPILVESTAFEVVP